MSAVVTVAERPAYIPERNWAIYAARAGGMRLDDIARHHGLSRQRVSQIVATTRYRIAHPPLPYGYRGPRYPEIGDIQQRARRWVREQGAAL